MPVAIITGSGGLIGSEAVDHFVAQVFDEASLAGHMASPHMADWRRRSAPLPVTSRDLKRYTVSDVRPL